MATKCPGDIDKVAFALGASRVGGVDECGVACLAGPMPACCAIFDRRVLDHDSWIRDSKDIPRGDALEDAARRVKELAVHWEIAELPPAEVTNFRQDAIATLTAAVEKAVRGASKRDRPRLVISDHHDLEPDIPDDVTVLGITDGDAKSLACAGASIIVKDYRDRLMMRLAEEYPGYSWETNAGGYNRNHREGISKLGLTPHHRSFYCQKYLENYDQWLKEDLKGST